jgi:hypothetical protein
MAVLRLCPRDLVDSHVAEKRSVDKFCNDNTEYRARTGHQQIRFESVNFTAFVESPSISHPSQARMIYPS